MLFHQQLISLQGDISRCRRTHSFFKKNGTFALTKSNGNRIISNQLRFRGITSEPRSQRAQNPSADRAQDPKTLPYKERKKRGRGRYTAAAHPGGNGRRKGGMEGGGSPAAAAAAARGAVRY
ncbi:hypothetical protein ABZP36_014175 [Zizania latifolia]